MPDIGELTDGKVAPPTHHVGTLIELWLEGEGSLSGSVGLEGREAITFQGWLGLVAALSELLSGPPS